MDRPRVVILRNPAKPDAQAKLASLVERLASCAKVVGTGVIEEAAQLLRERMERILVLGGDGTILAVARELGPRQVPIIGVNFGKLGFLAEFSLEEVTAQLDRVLSDPRLVSRRMMIQASTQRDGATREELIAVNDVVLHGGPPYRMIDLSITVDGDHLTQFSGDGLILATPCGSTAHNMSAGGPIVQSEIRAMIITPISPHSLTHRPLVVSGESRIEVLAQRVNEGTSVVADGQKSIPLQAGDLLVVQRHPHDFQLVHNPAQPRWYTLIKKLRWGR